jgi:hypothetical protein
MAGRTVSVQPGSSLAGVSTIEYMVGLNQQYTATATGNVLILLSGLAENFDNGGTTVTARVAASTFNPGSPATGTAIGMPQQVFAPNLTIPFTIIAIYHAALNQTLYYDLSVVATVGAGAGVRNISLVIVEL